VERRNWRFRKRPLVIEAVPAAVVLAGVEELPDWLEAALADGRVVITRHRVAVVTMQGMTFAHDNDMILRGTKGELYPVTPDVFAEVYEPDQ
jgi:hypothetical protein